MNKRKSNDMGMAAVRVDIEKEAELARMAALIEAKKKQIDYLRRRQEMQKQLALLEDEENDFGMYTNIIQ